MFARGGSMRRMKSRFGVVFSLSSIVGVACSHNEPGPATPGAAGGATAAAGTGKECPADYTIDDCEDGTNQVKVQKGRNGYWYTFVDKVGSTVSPPFGKTFIMSKGGPNGGSMYTAQFLG